jgi:hypothetical protein
MNKRILTVTIAAVTLVAAIVAAGYHYWGGPEGDPVLDVLGEMPADAASVLYTDVKALRQSPFLAELYKWAPQPATDADYTQFVQATGFSYERDLDRVGIAFSSRGQDTVIFAVADGHFDKKKISAYALQTGTRQGRDGHEIFSVPVSGEARRITFTFLRKDRIALTNGPSLDIQAADKSDAQAWRERFRRLAGSPIFAVIRQDAASTIASRSPASSRFQSPQFADLLNQLQWITVAGKPEAEHLRVVLEGEGPPQTNTRQMADLINSLLVFAQAGLNDPKLRQQLQPQVREAYLEVLKSTDVSPIDRGDTKSVRLMFDVTPNFLEAARAALPIAPAATPSKPVPSKGTIRN